jgi:hypothetical protein
MLYMGFQKGVNEAVFGPSDLQPDLRLYLAGITQEIRISGGLLFGKRVKIRRGKA